MSSQSSARKVKKFFRNADAIVFQLSGNHLKDVAIKAAQLYGEELSKRAARHFVQMEEPHLPPDNPYRILGLYPDAYDVVVRGAYRALARECHPDTANNPDPKRFQRITEAYNTIMAEREAKRSGRGSDYVPPGAAATP